VWSSQPQVFFLSPSQKATEGPRKEKGIFKQMWKDIQFRESWQVAHKGTQKTISFKTRGVCHAVALPFTIKGINYRYGKRRIMKTQIFHQAKI
jgi:hypothetical protein